MIGDRAEIANRVRTGVTSRRALLAGTVVGATGLTGLVAASPASAASQPGAASPSPSASPSASASASPAASAATSASGAPGSGWIDVTQDPYDADPTGQSDSTAAIQAALTAVPATGAVVYLPVGTYQISGALTVSSYTTIQGDGDGATIIKQTSTTSHGLLAVDAQHINVADVWLYGPSSGSGNGIHLGLNANPNFPYTSVRRVTLSHWGSHGVYVNTPIVSEFERVVSALNGGDGFHPSAPVACTSLRFSSCYANSNAGTGYFLVNAQYSVLEGCAADSNGNGYHLAGCHSVTINGCGAEGTTTDSFIFQGGSGNSVVGCWVYNNNATGIVVGAAESNLTLIGCTKNGPLAAASWFISATAGSSGALLNATNVSQNNLPAAGWTTLA